MVALVDREFSNADYRSLNAIDRDTAYRELHDLAQRKLIQVIGNGAGARYRVLRESVSVPSVKEPRSPRERLIARMTEVGFVTNVDYRDAFTVDRNTAKLALARWLAAGILAKEGERRGTRYLPGEHWPPTD